ncbi:MAG: 4-hydroxy-tetrahydrodipicolinate synthase [Oscillospiraceae bacterium]|jgi:4-hydroxy-tetrahydrodipicolinate synthase|nr:4-hydroxy-tetrahydrodipicolinate synthase [Oscillospiraceae bacterium]
MKKTIFTGSGVALITPMNPDGSINYGCFGALIEEHIEKGTGALIVCGTTGESSTMTDDEHRECIRFAVEKSAGRIPVIAGTGSNDTAYMIELSVEAKELGADAILIVSPYYNKASQRGLVASFTAVADAVDIPIILYNIPGRTNVNISIDTFKELAKHPNIKAVKESGGDINYFARIIEACGDDLDVYSGDDCMTVPAMSLGAKGVVSVIANIAPELMRDICALCFKNDFRAAGALQVKYARLCMDLLTLDINPVPIKAAMNLVGKNVGGCRLPLYKMSDAALEKLRVSLGKAGLL